MGHTRMPRARVPPNFSFPRRVFIAADTSFPRWNDGGRGRGGGGGRRGWGESAAKKDESGQSVSWLRLFHRRHSHYERVVGWERRHERKKKKEKKWEIKSGVRGKNGCCPARQISLPPNNRAETHGRCTWKLLSGPPPPPTCPLLFDYR